MKSSARIALTLSLAVAAAIGWRTAPAQRYPSKPVRLIVPYPAGVGFDVLARALTQEMSKGLGQPVLVDNRPGVSTIAGAESCARSPADGYTACTVSRDTLSFNPHLRPSLPYDPVKDFDLVTGLVFQTSVLAVNASLPARSMQELIALARSRPGALNYGSMGAGSVTHMFMEVVKKKNGVNMVHVPYKGPAPLIQALVANEVQVTYFSAASTIGHIRAGKLKALAVSGNKRSPLLPEVPAVSELGVTELDDRVWYAMLVPAGSPKDGIARLAAEVARIFADPAFRDERLVKQGWEPVTGTPEQFAQFIVSDRKVGAEMVKISGARLD